MNAPVWPERLLRRQAGAEPELELATDGVQRWVWESRFGTMLIEVRDGEVFVNRERVAPAEPAPRAEAVAQSR
jgi:hypothetical protein